MPRVRPVAKWEPCPVCDRPVHVKLDGRLRKHMVKPRNLGGAPCDGSDRKVVELDDATDPV